MHLKSCSHLHIKTTQNGKLHGWAQNRLKISTGKLKFAIQCRELVDLTVFYVVATDITRENWFAFGSTLFTF